MLAYNAAGALAGFASRAENGFMRRLTDLDLDRPPRSRAVRGRARIVVREDGGERFRVYLAQELAHDVAHAVLDAAEGLRMKDVFRVRRMWRPHGELKRRYDVVIVGGGSHGLATAYYLAKRHGIKDVAILEKSYIGSGASGRNTKVIRANYRTPEGAAFYKESVKLYERLSAELDFNLMFSQHGHLTLTRARTAGLVVAQERAEVNKLLGIDSERRDAAGDPRDLPAARRLRPADVSDPRRPLPPAGRDHPPRRRRLGLRARRRPARRPYPPVHRGGPGSSGTATAANTTVETNRGRVEVRSGRERDGRLVVARRATRRDRVSRSRRTSSRPS